MGKLATYNSQNISNFISYRLIQLLIWPKVIKKVVYCINGPAQFPECWTFWFSTLHQHAAALPMLLHRHQLLAQLLGQRDFRQLLRTSVSWPLLGRLRRIRPRSIHCRPHSDHQSFNHDSGCKQGNFYCYFNNFTIFNYWEIKGMVMFRNKEHFHFSNNYTTVHH